ncbi:hypothetical protein SNK03_006959 [Fusarium graminearum]
MLATSQSRPQTAGVRTLVSTGILTSMGTLPLMGTSTSMVAIPTNMAIVSGGAGEDGSRRSFFSERKHQIANRSGARRDDLTNKSCNLGWFSKVIINDKLRDFFHGV